MMSKNAVIRSLRAIYTGPAGTRKVREYMNNYVEEYIDIAIVGAGHAGCEAALAAARLGLDTVVFTVSVDSRVRAKRSNDFFMIVIVYFYYYF